MGVGVGNGPGWIRLVERVAGSPRVRAGLGAIFAPAVLHPRFTLPLPRPDFDEASIPAPEAAATSPWVWRPGPRPVVPDVVADAAPAGRGPLAGWTFAVKDNIDVAGAPTWDGTAVVQHVAAEDAAMVRRLAAAGAVLAGKVQMTELGIGGLGLQPHHGTLANPIAPDCLAGGSSTGSAVAVARGLVRVALGSDALGSVRIPAAFCGLYGLKPTHPLVGPTVGPTFELAGYASVAPSLDMPGILARTLADIEATFAVLVPGSTPFAHQPRIATLAHAARWPLHPALRAVYTRATQALATPTLTLAHPGRVTVVAALTGGHELLASEVPCPPHALLETRVTYAAARLLTPRIIAAIQAERASLRAAIHALFAHTDVLLLPTTACPPPVRTAARLAQASDLRLLAALSAFTTLANLAGLPALAVPVGRDARGRPLSLQLVGPPGGEAALFAAARLLPVP